MPGRRVLPQQLQHAVVQAAPRWREAVGSKQRPHSPIADKGKGDLNHPEGVSEVNHVLLSKNRSIRIRVPEAALISGTMSFE